MVSNVNPAPPCVTGEDGEGKAKTFTPGAVAGQDVEMEEDEEPEKTGPTPQQLLALKAAIANAATLEEVTRLENALTTGIVPSDLTV